MVLKLNQRYKWDFKLVYKLYIKEINILQLENLDQNLIIFIFWASFLVKSL